MAEQVTLVTERALDLPISERQGRLRGEGGEVCEMGKPLTESESVCHSYVLARISSLGSSRP